MAMLVLRLIFVFIAAGVGTLFLPPEGWEGPPWLPYMIFSGVMLLAAGVISVDIFFDQKRIELISAIYFGLLVGMLLTILLSLGLNPLLATVPQRAPITLMLAVILCYGCVSMLIQTKDDFRFIIPYVEFARDLKGLRPFVLDTSAIIDGRIADLADTSILDSQLVMPRFVLLELQAIADSSDKLRRVRGRRGLDILNRLRTHEKVDFVLYDRDLPEFAGQPVDMKLVLLAKHLNGKLVTGDFNLNKVSKLHNVEVININEIAKAIRPQFLPGEAFQLRVVKQGEGQDQGIGYLDDGTMVVVEGGRDRIGKTIPVTVTSTLQTQSGRMIFTRMEDMETSEA
ncbi:MAG: TRAM domain-containing protein [Pirellulaceae bacterium]|nr:TRAM domain-containing protein [Pirellulaceae bacterium]